MVRDAPVDGGQFENIVVFPAYGLIAYDSRDVVSGKVRSRDVSIRDLTDQALRQRQSHRLRDARKEHPQVAAAQQNDLAAVGCGFGHHYYGIFVALREDAIASLLGELAIIISLDRYLNLETLLGKTNLIGLFDYTSRQRIVLLVDRCFGTAAIGCKYERGGRNKGLRQPRWDRMKAGATL